MKNTPDIEDAGCAKFESTLGLMDGALSGAARVQAEQHAASCPLCGPMVAEWAPLNKAIVHHFDDKAELAKPQLARMSDRVFAAIDGPAKKASMGWFARLAERLHISQRQFGFVAAAAAVAIVLVPLARTGTVGPTPSPSPTAQSEAEDEHTGDFHVHELAFDGASGTVYTADDDTPVIWVTESDGA